MTDPDAVFAAAQRSQREQAAEQNRAKAAQAARRQSDHTAADGPLTREPWDRSDKRS
jgi:hypothetical protein